MATWRAATLGWLALAGAAPARANTPADTSAISARLPPMPAHARGLPAHAQGLKGTVQSVRRASRQAQWRVTCSQVSGPEAATGSEGSADTVSVPEPQSTP